MIIDFHTHVFPDPIADRAIAKLEAAGGETAFLNGRLSGLHQSMDTAGISSSVVLHVATKPGQETTINQWAATIQSDAVVSFGALHPDSPNWRDTIQRIVDLGLLGVKLHPDYQQFFVDDRRMFPIYEELCRQKLIVLLHSGVDIGLPNPVHCPPRRLAKVINFYPEGIWVAAHMGGWKQWDQVEQYLVGSPVYLDTSFSYPQLGKARMKRIIEEHGPYHILFGTDSPWADQGRAVQEIESLGLTKKELSLIFSDNARSLLNRHLTNTP